jgi:predicted protein tyrosine phosphatase
MLCVCSAGLLRSPTAAYVFSQEPYNYNTRAAGLDVGHALIPVDKVLIAWADLIVCMNEEQKERLTTLAVEYKLSTEAHPLPIYSFDIIDNFSYRDERLIQLLQEQFKEIVENDIHQSK